MNRLKPQNSFKPTFLINTKRLSNISLVERELQELYNEEKENKCKYFNSLLNAMLTVQVSTVVLSRIMLKGIVESDIHRINPIKFNSFSYKSFIGYLINEIGCKVTWIHSKTKNTKFLVITLPDSIKLDFSLESDEVHMNRILKVLNATVTPTKESTPEVSSIVKEPVIASFKRPVAYIEPLKEEVATTLPTPSVEPLKTAITSVKQAVSNLEEPITIDSSENTVLLVEKDGMPLSEEMKNREDEATRVLRSVLPVVKKGTFFSIIKVESIKSKLHKRNIRLNEEDIKALITLQRQYPELNLDAIIDSSISYNEILLPFYKKVSNSN